MRAGYYRPLVHHAVRVTTDAQGFPATWRHRIVTQSIMKGAPPGSPGGGGRPSSRSPDARPVTPPCKSSRPVKYDPDVWRGVGRALLIAALDLKGANPWSRVPGSELRTLEGVRKWARAAALARWPCPSRTVRCPTRVSLAHGVSSKTEWAWAAAGVAAADVLLAAVSVSRSATGEKLDSRVREYIPPPMRSRPPKIRKSVKSLIFLHF